MVEVGSWETKGETKGTGVDPAHSFNGIRISNAFHVTLSPTKNVSVNMTFLLFSGCHYLFLAERVKFLATTGGAIDFVFPLFLPWAVYGPHRRRRS